MIRLDLALMLSMLKRDKRKLPEDNGQLPVADETPRVKRSRKTHSQSALPQSTEPIVKSAYSLRKRITPTSRDHGCVARAKERRVTFASPVSPTPITNPTSRYVRDPVTESADVSSGPNQVMDCDVVQSLRHPNLPSSALNRPIHNSRGSNPNAHGALITKIPQQQLRNEMPEVHFGDKPLMVAAEILDPFAEPAHYRPYPLGDRVNGLLSPHGASRINMNVQTEATMTAEPMHQSSGLHNSCSPPMLVETPFVKDKPNNDNRDYVLDSGFSQLDVILASLSRKTSLPTPQIFANLFGTIGSELLASDLFIQYQSYFDLYDEEELLATFGMGTSGKKKPRPSIQILSVSSQIPTRVSTKWKPAFPLSSLGLVTGRNACSIPDQ